MSKPVPAAAVWALGVTQIVGYGSLYYAFSVLAPAMSADFGWSTEWIFGALTLSLLIGGFAAPFTGRLLDRIGAARGMAIGSAFNSLFLILMAVAPSGPAFTVALILMEVASTLVLYAAAFAVLVQLAGSRAQASITHLTLIAGFASTLFWPLTALLDAQLGWRATYLVFAAMNIIVCLPLHLWLARLSPALFETMAAAHEAAPQSRPTRPTPLFVLVLIGFALEGLVLAAITLQMVPILIALDLGPHMVLISSLFGPAQGLARLVNMVFGGGLKPTALALVAAIALPLALLLLTLSAPSIVGAMGFALLFGLASGLTSIVSGALPLYLFGRRNYGARQGQISAARQVAAAAAPFAMALVIGQAGIDIALWSWIGLALLPVACFLAIALLSRSALRPDEAPVQASASPMG